MTNITLNGQLCTNPTNGGEIQTNQAICSGIVPDTLKNMTLPSGYSGSIEYKWQSSVTDSSSGFTDVIPSATGTFYAPDTLRVTTWYRRLSKVACEDAWSLAGASNVVKIKVEQIPVSGTLHKVPATSKVCEGTEVYATFIAGSGGNGIDSTTFRTNDGTSWTAWQLYTPGTNISTTGKTSVRIRTKRKANYCNDSEFFTRTWAVENTPVSGTFTKSPDVTTVCEGTKVSATLNAGSGGNGVDSLFYRIQADTIWSAWSVYASGDTILTSGKAKVELKTFRNADTCANASPLTVSWIVSPATAGGQATGGTEVCYGSNNTQLTVSGHVGSVLYWEYSSDSITWDSITGTAEHVQCYKRNGKNILQGNGKKWCMSD